MKQGQVRAQGTFEGLQDDPYLNEIVSIHADQITSYRQGKETELIDEQKSVNTQATAANKSEAEPQTATGIFGLTDEEIKTKLRQFEGRKSPKKNAKNEKQDSDSEKVANEAKAKGQLIKSEDDDQDNTELQFETFYKLYELLGGLNALL